jgi:hypothetical protein
MFGGTDDAQIFIDTWEWRGSWSKIPTIVAPSPVDRTLAAYDHDLGRVVLMGGDRGGSSTASVLAWDGTAWRRLQDANGMGIEGPTFQLHGVAYDARRKRVIAYGGYDYQGNPIEGTWEFDGTAWTEIQTPTAPGPRRLPALTYDPERGVVVMYGGRTPTNTFLGDTWTYDGVDWTLRATTGPPPLEGASFGFLGPQHVAIMFGGRVAADVYGGTWAWNGTSWTQRFPANQPSSRQYAAMVPDGRGRLILFGGYESGGEVGDTWFYDGTNWRQQPIPSPRATASGVLDPDRRRLIITTGNSGLGDTWELSSTGWQSFLSKPAGTQFVGLVYDEKRREVLAYGGAGATVPGELWLYVNGTWTKKTTAGTPPPASVIGRLVWDTEHERVLAIAPTLRTNSTGEGPLDDTTNSLWSWDGTTWSEIVAAHRFPRRIQPVVGYDRIRHQVVVYGGSDGNTAAPTQFRDTWVFENGDWHEVVAPAGAEAPVPNLPIPMVWNPLRGRLTMIDTAMTAWEWTGTWWEQVPASDRPAPRNAFVFVPSFDGRGLTIMLGGALDEWHLRWDGVTPSESCARPLDIDGDGLTGCGDPDCWSVCAPQCPPQTSCAANGPTCGDGACSPAENCFMCPGDCPCATVCGDFVCQSGETGCPGDCP